MWRVKLVKVRKRCGINQFKGPEKKGGYVSVGGAGLNNTRVWKWGEPKFNKRTVKKPGKARKKGGGGKGRNETATGEQFEEKKRQGKKGKKKRAGDESGGGVHTNTQQGGGGGGESTQRRNEMQKKNDVREKRRILDGVTTGDTL